MKPYTVKCDVWSLGVITYMMLSGQRPYWDDNPMRLLKKVVDPNVTHRMTGATWNPISAEAKDFVNQCLRKDPDDRPSIDKILQHPWLHMEESASGEAVDLTDRVQEFRKGEVRRRFRKAVNGVIFTNRLASLNA